MGSSRLLPLTLDVGWLLSAVLKHARRSPLRFSAPVAAACTKAFDCVDHNKLWEILKEMGIPDLPLEQSVCRSGNNS